MPWPLYIALRQIFPAGKLISFFALASVTGVSLGVMVLLVVQSVMNGFVQEIRGNLARSNGDIRLFSERLVDDWAGLRDSLLQRPEVAAATPVAQGVVMMQSHNRPVFPFVWGIELNTGPEVFPMQEFILSGDLDDLDDRAIMVSSGVARSLGLYVGSMVEIYTPLMLDRMKADEVILPYNLVVAGIFGTGWNEIDANTVIVTLRTMQELYGLEDSVHGMALRLHDPDRATAVARSLDADLPEHLFTRTWMELNEDFLFILRLEKTVMFFIMIFIILVASFSIAVSLMLAVVRKTREIGLLVSMGATRAAIAASFCLQGLLLGTAGTLLGMASAVTILHFREGILRQLAFFADNREAFLQAYGFADLPVHYIAGDFVLVSIFTVLVSTLAGLVPAIRAARLHPAEALRHE